ncbi:glycosyltransferase [Enterococcus sp. AZ154]|uniref:glycosyltransferase n=1 Tax=unclassified Enterococcus TaxID=2608891 RepID=UPI003D2664A6
MNIVVILNYNDAFNTLKIVNSLVEFNRIDRIIVVDNNSSDDSEKHLQSLNKKPKIDLIFNKTNNGYSAGNNLGLRYAAKKYKVKNYIISNPDIIISEEDFNLLVDDIKTDGAKAISGLVADNKNKIVRNFAWKFPTYYHLFSETTFFTTKVSEVINKSRFYNFENYDNKIMKVDVLSGCFFIIDGALFESVGFFDETTFLYGEENLLFKKISLVTEKVFVDTRVKITHIGGTSTKKSIGSFINRQKILLESQKVYILKWLKASKLIMPWYICCFKIGTFEKYIISKIRNKF